VIRTHEAGVLRAADVGTTVKLAGWVARRRDHGGVIFVDLRDASGVVQVVFREEVSSATAAPEPAEAPLGGVVGGAAHSLRNEYCVLVTGTVQRRPEGNDNPDLPTGQIEVVATSLEILSEAAPLPVPVDDQVDVGDDVRLKYRYLDLRRSGPARAMRLRAPIGLTL
jgi:aspartyl-tRNA synthetase